MLKRLIKNIIPFTLLLHISSCSSFGVNKSEMKGACEIIDETLSYSGDNDFKNIKNSGKFSSILKGQKTKILDEENVNTILNDPKNQTCLKNLKDNIANWGKNDFTKALDDCLFLREKAYTDPQGQEFTTTPETQETKDTGYTKEYLEGKKNLFNNLAIIKNHNYYYNNSNYYYNDNNYYYHYNINNETNFKSVNGANLACARLIAVDLNQETAQLSYRIKYLPYIFISGYSANKDKMKLPSDVTATTLLKSLRFINNYCGVKKVNNKSGFTTFNGQNLTNNENSHHTDSERVLFLCLAADGNKIKLNLDLGGVEPINKLKDFVTDKTIDLCIQIRNTYAMCGNCQCFYTGIDKIDLNDAKFLFRNENGGTNILGALKEMEGPEGNDYTKSLVLATRKGNLNKNFGTKIFMENQSTGEIYKNSGIYYDTDSNPTYVEAQRGFYTKPR